MSENDFDDGVIRPLQVPAEHDPKGPLRERTIYALADIGSGTAKRVAAKLQGLGDADATEASVQEILDGLFDGGLVNGSGNGGDRIFDLSKVTRAHGGHVQ